MNQEECICALATPAGGAIGIIRLSGSDAITLTDKIFQSANGKSLEEAKPYTLHYGDYRNQSLYKACLSVSQGANLGEHLLGFS